MSDVSAECNGTVSQLFFFFQTEDGIRDKGMYLEFRRVLFRSLRALASSPMAWPPYFTTTISSSYCCMCGSASTRMWACCSGETVMCGPGVLLPGPCSGRG